MFLWYSARICWYEEGVLLITDGVLATAGSKSKIHHEKRMNEEKKASEKWNAERKIAARAERAK